MTTYEKPPNGKPPKPRHDVALWAGAAAFFGSMAAITAIDILNPSDLVGFIGALVVAIITAGSVYSKERLDAAKREEQQRGDTAPPQ